MTNLATRQVHLDFHTSELIEDIAAQFDQAQFARTVKDAHINSVTVFGRCHHGWLYYPSAKFPEMVHPHLTNRNLLFEQIDALHAEGIKAPIYITVQWDYYSARNHPEWLIRKRDGSHEGGSFLEPGFYQSLCVNTGYYEYLSEITSEICQLAGDRLDGLFFDITGIRPCLCTACRNEMKQNGIAPDDETQARLFAKMSIDRFKSRMTALVRKYDDKCTIFYNAGHVGPCTMDSKDAYTHFELESLPSGGWGYLHFPVSARYARTLGKDCMGMTGKFHTEWGDFHSLKNLAALEYECFRMLSYGFACSIGDQLEPNGRLNKATYKLIGDVYGQIEGYEEWARPSVPVVEMAILTSEDSMHEFAIPDSIMGAAQMLEELAYQFDIIDASRDFSDYKLLLLTEDFTASPEIQQRINDYVINGDGHVISCAKGGINEENKYPSCFGIKYECDEPMYPSFIEAAGPMADGLERDNLYVIYKQGIRVSGDGAEVLLYGTDPYFMREGDRFCSHRYTPADHGEKHPTALQNGNVILFTHPLFTQYRSNAPKWCKTLISNAVERLLPERVVKHDGPSTLSVQVLHQPDKNRYVLHILTYIPVRKSATIDIIEERTTVRNVKFTTGLDIKKAEIVPKHVELPLDGNSFSIPEIDGYAVVELSY